MPLLIPPGFAQAAVEMRHVNDPDPWYCTFGVDTSAAGGDFLGVAESIWGAWSSTIGLQLSTNVSTTGVTLRVGQDGGPPLIVNYVDTSPGTASAAMLPQNCAALYDKSTASAGRRNRGRFFIPGILKEGQVSDTGIIESAARADLQIQASAFLDSLNTGGGVEPDIPSPMVILHNSGVGVGAPTVVTALTVQSTISTQRRRLR